MPIIVDGAVVNPPQPVEALSPDGVLHIWADPDHGGVRMLADFNALPLSGVDRVAFVRDDVPVRGGDTAPAIGGIALGYDHESALGSTITFQAVAYDLAGAEIGISARASIIVPEPTGLLDLWVKSINNPSLSMLVSARIPAPEIGWAARLTLVTPQGSAYPAGKIDKRTAQPIDLVVRLALIEDRRKWDLLMDSGHLYIQWRSSYGEDGFYAVAGDSSRSVFLTMIDQRRDVRTAFTPIARPTSIGARTRIPGSSIEDARTEVPNISQAVLRWPTILAAAGFPDA